MRINLYIKNPIEVGRKGWIKSGGGKVDLEVDSQAIL